MLKSIKQEFLNNSLFSRAIPVALSIWILSLTAYYYINVSWLGFFNSWRPDTKELITETLKFHWVPVFLSRLPYVFYALILNFIALLIGNRILRWLRVDLNSNIEKIVFSVPLGWGVYSIGIFWLGISGLLYKEAVYCFLTLLGVLSILEIKRFFSPPHPTPLPHGERIEVRGSCHCEPKAKQSIDKTDLIFLPVIILFLAVQLITSFSPVWWGDALRYHMALPKLCIKYHGLVYVPGFFIFSTLPAHTEMLYLLGLITSGETLSKLFSFSISSMFLISILSFGTKYFSKGIGYLATVIWIPSVSTFSCCFSEPGADVSLALFSLLGVYAFFMWIEERKEGYLYLSIIFCALAAATKIQGLFFVLLFFAGFFVTVKKDEQVLKKLLWCTLVVFIVALPWYIRNWWLTGDPFFPFLYHYLGANAEYWNKYLSKYSWEFLSHPALRGPKSFSDFIKINKDLFFYIRGIENLWANAKIFTFIFLIPALITFRNWNRLIRYSFFVTLLYYIFYIFTSPQSRFFYVGIAILGIIVAHFIKTVWTKYLLPRIPIILCIVAFSIVSFFDSVKWVEGPFFAGLGVLDKKQFFNESHNYKVSTWVNENLPEDSKILSWETYGYHLDREYMLANPLFQSVLDFDAINDIPTFLNSIKKLNITHLTYESNAGFPRRLREFLDKCVSELFENGKITLIKQIDRCAIYSIAVPSDYFVLDDNIIRFNDESQRKYLVRGWSGTEEWGTWSEGKESVILVNLKGQKNEIVRHGESASGMTSPASGGLAMTNNRDYTMRIKATGFSIPDKQQSVKIYLDDNLLGEHIFTHPVTYFEDIEIKIPSSYIKEGNQRIRFVYSFVGSPAEHGMGPDVRQLAMGVSSVEFIK